MNHGSQTPDGVREIIKTVTELNQAKVVEFTAGNEADGTIRRGAAIAHPPGLTLTALSNYLHEEAKVPNRRKGTARMQALESLIQHVNRHKAPNSALFATYNRSGSSASLTAVLDYNLGGAETETKSDLARFCEHRCEYLFPLSDEWKAWGQANGKAMSIEPFAEFLEDRIIDVIDPVEVSDTVAGQAKRIGLQLASITELLTLSRGLSVNVETEVHNHNKLQTGEAQIVFKEAHKTSSGEPLIVPGGFVISIPVFEGGTPYNMLVRLRYTVRQGGMKWTCMLSRFDLAFLDAFHEACELAKSETQLPIFYGSPE